MERFGIALNLALAIFSLVWLAGHMTVRIGDLEFWFALLYSVGALANLALWTRAERRDAAREM